MTRRSIPLDSIVDRLHGNEQIFDKARRDGLERLDRHRTIQSQVLQRQVDRYAAHDLSHPRLTAIKKRLACNKELSQSVKRAQQRSQLEVPQAAENQWILYGRVHRRGQEGIRRMEVGLFDENGRHIESAGFVQSNAQGQFSIGLDLQDEPTPGERRNKIQVHIFRPNGDLALIDEDPVTPTPGAVDYREFEVSAAPVSRKKTSRKTGSKKQTSKGTPH